MPIRDRQAREKKSYIQYLFNLNILESTSQLSQIRRFWALDLTEVHELSLATRIADTTKDTPLALPWKILKIHNCCQREF